MKIHPVLPVQFCAVLSLLSTGMAQSPKLAQADLKYFETLVAASHLIERVELQTGANTFERYRYDRYPGVERIITDAGISYVRLQHSGWRVSDDWGKTGFPADEKTGATLDTFANVAGTPFEEPVHRDKSQGDTAWKLVEKTPGDGYDAFTFERSREKPRRDGAYPRYTFVKHKEDTDGHLILSESNAQLRDDGGKLIPVTIKYDYTSDVIPLAQPEEWLAAGKRIADSKPQKVEALVPGDANCRLSGIIFGRDFDLTVQTPDRVYRQIAIGNDCWQDENNSNTWIKQKETDRRYYYLVHTPVKYTPQEMIPPFETVDTTEENGETLQHIRFKAPDTVEYEGDRNNYWIAMKDGKVTGIRRAHEPVGFGNNYVISYVEYSDVPDGKGVMPPPGNPAAVLPQGAEALLMKASKNMQTGVWKVDGWAETARIRGLISGKDFDLTETAQDGSPIVHQITIKDKSWGSLDDDKTWKRTRSDDRLVYNLVHVPIMADRMQPTFEVVATEEHDGEKWLHIQLKRKDNIQSERERPHYWLLLDKEGQPLSVRRAAEYMSVQNGMVYCTVDFMRANEGEAIRPPSKLK